MPTEHTCGKGRVLRRRQGDDKAKPRLHGFIPFSEQRCAPQHLPQSPCATRSCCRRYIPDISAQSSLNTPRPSPPGTFIWPNAKEIPHHFSTADFKFHFFDCFRADCMRNAPPGNSTMRSRSELTMLRLRSAGRSRPDGCFFWLHQLMKPFVGLRFRLWTYKQ